MYKAKLGLAKVDPTIPARYEKIPMENAMKTQVNKFRLCIGGLVLFSVSSLRLAMLGISKSLMYIGSVVMLQVSRG